VLYWPFDRLPFYISSEECTVFIMCVFFIFCVSCHALRDCEYYILVVGILYLTHLSFYPVSPSFLKRDSKQNQNGKMIDDFVLGMENLCIF